MGLFIGASLLTILEILDYLCEVGVGPQLRERGGSKLRDPGEGVHWPPPPLLAPRCSETESWDTFGTRSAPQSIPEPTW